MVGSVVSEYVDPRNPDPLFPDRPTHEDFIVLSEAAQSMDYRAEELGEPVDSIVGVDMESLDYFIENRLAILSDRVLVDFSDPLLMALYLDAFTLGKHYAERKRNDGS